MIDLPTIHVAASRMGRQLIDNQRRRIGDGRQSTIHVAASRMGRQYRQSTTQNRDGRQSTIHVAVSGMVGVIDDDAVSGMVDSHVAASALGRGRL